jgi:hypothetical protein
VACGHRLFPQIVQTMKVTSGTGHPLTGGIFFAHS